MLIKTSMDIANIIKPYKNTIGKTFIKRNIPIIRIMQKKAIFQVGLGEKQRRFIYDDIGTSVARRICGNKNYTKYFLEQIGAPTPRGFKVHSILEVEDALNKLEKPVVIKPISEMWGKGITTNIKTPREAKKAFLEASKYKGNYAIMEEQVQGDDHRILILGGNYIAGLRRTPPIVIGDGEKTIQQLIDEENKKRKFSKKIVKKILIDQIVLDYFEKNNLSLKSVLSKGKKIRIRMTGNICSGGISKNITKEVHPSTIELCKEIAACLDLEIAGVDILTTDISKPLSATNGKITEVNQNPDILMHTNPYAGEPLDTVDLFTRYLFPKEKDAWISITRNGERINSIDELFKCLEVIPKKVSYKKSSRKKTASRPGKPLLVYLLNNQVTSVKL